jgi:hypothetical protein
MQVGGELKQVSAQYTAHLLCANCEDLLNKHGEKWVLANIPQNYDRPFPLQDAINLLTPVFKGRDLVLCDVRGVSAFNIKQLVYFGISIFWRGGVHQWRTTTGLVLQQVNLGGAEEPIRKFLLGESSLPDDIVLTVDVWPYKNALQAAYPALAAHSEECQRYWFYVPGLIFSLYMGENIPTDVRLRNAVKGAIGLDIAAADSVAAITKRGVKSKSGQKMEALNKEIAAVRPTITS